MFDVPVRLALAWASVGKNYIDSSFPSLSKCFVQKSRFTIFPKIFHKF